MTIDIARATSAIAMICLVSASSCMVSGVFSTSVACSMPEIWPTSVHMPVAVTRISPVPRVTLVFMYAMSTRSPSGVSAPATASICLGTGRLSPVSADSSISSVAAFNSRPSAGTRSPASTSTMSPGTISLGGQLRDLAIAPHPRLDDQHLLQRGHARLGLALLVQAHGMALNSVRPSSTMPVPHWRRMTMLITPATSSTICIGSWYWRRNACVRDSFLAGAKRIGTVLSGACLDLGCAQPARGVDALRDAGPRRRRACARRCRRSLGGSAALGVGGLTRGGGAHRATSASVHFGHDVAAPLRLDIAVRRLAFGELHRLARYLLVGEL